MFLSKGSDYVGEESSGVACLKDLSGVSAFVGLLVFSMAIQFFLVLAPVRLTQGFVVIGRLHDHSFRYRSCRVWYRGWDSVLVERASESTEWRVVGHNTKPGVNVPPPLPTGIVVAQFNPVHHLGSPYSKSIGSSAGSSHFPRVPSIVWFSRLSMAPY